METPTPGAEPTPRDSDRIPIILTSRADTVLARMASCAVALVAARRGRLSAP